MAAALNPEQRLQHRNQPPLPPQTGVCQQEENYEEGKPGRHEAGMYRIVGTGQQQRVGASRECVLCHGILMRRKLLKGNRRFV